MVTVPAPLTINSIGPVESWPPASAMFWWTLAALPLVSVLAGIGATSDHQTARARPVRHPPLRLRPLR
jgi:hypothetical protein